MNDLHKRDVKFLEWLSKAYSKLPEGEDFQATDEFMFELWKRCWHTAFATGLAHGRHQAVLNQKERKRREREAMPKEVMLGLFTNTLSGREFGRAVEAWHGIKEQK